MDIPDREGPDTDAPDEGDATGNGSKSSTAPLRPHFDEGDKTSPQKRMRTISHNLDLEDRSARHVHIECKSEGNPDAFKNINSFKITDALEELIGWYPDSKTLNNGVLLVECESYTQVLTLLQTFTFLDLPVRATVAFNIGTVRGVVRDARVRDMSEDLLLDRLREQHVVQVRPIMTGSGVNRRKTEYLILAFRLTDLPDKIYFGRERLKVTPYRLKVYQCTKCCFFGHRSENCRRLRACAHCGFKGENHDPTSTCINSQPKCVLCGGAHKANDTNCPRYRRQKAILKIKEDHKVGFRRAEEIFRKKGGLRGPSRIAPTNSRNRRSGQTQPPPQAIPADPLPAFNAARLGGILPTSARPSFAAVLSSPKPSTSGEWKIKGKHNLGTSRRKLVHSMSASVPDTVDTDNSLSNDISHGSIFGSAAVASGPSATVHVPSLRERIIVSPARETTPVLGGATNKIVLSSPDNGGARHQNIISIKLNSFGEFIKEFGNALTVENGKGDIAIEMSHLSGLITKFFNFTVDAVWCQNVFKK